MSQSAVVFRIMVASPGDVKTEREEIVKTIYKWNSSNTSKNNVVLLPLLWEIDAPQGIAEDGQDLIDRHLISNSDMIIAIFFSKLGRSTSKGIKYTIHELKKHIEQGKQVILFFKDPPKAKNSKDLDNIKEVFEFKENIKQELGVSALYCEYKSLSEFKSIIYTRLDSAVHAHLLSNMKKSTTGEYRFSDITIPRHALQMRIQEAKKSVFISGVSLISTITTNFDYCIEKQIPTRLLMAANNPDLISRCAQLSYTKPEELAAHVNATLTHFKICGLHPLIELRCLDAVIPFAFVGIDIDEPYGKIYVQQYLYEFDPASNPNYACFSGEKWFEVYKEQINSLWKDGVPITFDNGDK